MNHIRPQSGTVQERLWRSSPHLFGPEARHYLAPDQMAHRDDPRYNDPFFRVQQVNRLFQGNGELHGGVPPGEVWFIYKYCREELAVHPEAIASRRLRDAINDPLPAWFLYLGELVKPLRPAATRVVNAVSAAHDNGDHQKVAKTAFVATSALGTLFLLLRLSGRI